LRPLHCVSGHVNSPALRLTEHQTVKLLRLGRVRLGHQMPIPIERRLDGRVPELRLDVLRMCPLGD